MGSLSSEQESVDASRELSCESVMLPSLRSFERDLHRRAISDVTHQHGMIWSA